MGTGLPDHEATSLVAAGGDDCIRFVDKVIGSWRKCLSVVIKFSEVGGRGMNEGFVWYVYEV